MPAVCEFYHCCLRIWLQPFPRAYFALPGNAMKKIFLEFFHNKIFCFLYLQRIRIAFFDYIERSTVTGKKNIDIFRIRKFLKRLLDPFLECFDIQRMSMVLLDTAFSKVYTK